MMLDPNQAGGGSTFGYKIFLQLLARKNPDIVVSKLSQVCIFKPWYDGGHFYH